MNKEEQLETLWNSHDFYLRQIETLEDEYVFLSERTKEYFVQPLIASFQAMSADPEFAKTLPKDIVKDVEELISEYEEENVPVDKDELVSQINKVSGDLEELYKKHINIIDELKKFYSENPYDIPDHREIEPDSLPLLRESSANLLKVHITCKNNMLSEIEEYLGDD